MQSNKIIFWLLGLFSFTACQQTEVDAPSFNATAMKTTYKIGDTVRYKFEGNPDFITFYSGEPGKRYDFVNRISATGTPKLQFTSALANGTQPNSLQILISSDFAGPGANEAESAANINKATWTDVTGKAILSSGPAVTSGAIDLSDIAALGKPVYVAFKYVAAVGSVQNKWTITDLNISNALPDGATYTIANLSSAPINNYGVSYGISPGWATYRTVPGVNWTLSASSMVITGATSAVSATSPAETWAISGQLDLRRVSQDLGTYLKGMSTTLFDYTYKYTTPGTYVSTFVGTNSLVGKKKEEVKKIQITVTQ